MQIVTFTTQESDWRSPRVGALVDSQFLLDFERAFEGTPPPESLAWLDLDGPERD